MTIYEYIPMVRFKFWNTAFLCVYVGISILSFYITSTIPYPTSLAFLTDYYSEIPSITELPTYLTGARYTAFPWYFAGISLPLAYLLLVSCQYLGFSVNRFLRDTGQSIADTVAFIRNEAGVGFYGCLILLLSVLIGRWLYYVEHLPPYIDELYSYYNFAKADIFLTTVYYPAGNNHIFYNVLNTLFCDSFENPLVSLRFSAFLYLVITVGILYVTSYKRWGLLPAFFCSLTAVLLPVDSLFGHQGRGYTLISLLALLGAIHAIQWIQTKRHHHLHWIALTTILGAYTVPVYIYTIVGILLFLGYHLLVSKDFRQIPVLIWLGVWIGTGVFLLYLPIFLANGWDVLFRDNSFFEKLSISEIFTTVFQKTILRRWALLTLPVQLGIAFVGLAVIVTFLRFYRKINFSFLQNNWIQLAGFGIAGAALVILAQGIIPAGRVWTYLGVWIAAALGSVYATVHSNFFQKHLIWSVCFWGFWFVGLGVYSYKTYTHAVTDLYYAESGIVSTEVHQLAKTYLSARPEAIFVRENNMLYMLLLEKDSQDSDTKIHTQWQKQQSYTYAILPEKETLPPPFNTRFTSIDCVNWQGNCMLTAYQAIP